MKKFKKYSNTALFSALFMMTFIMGGCGGSSSCDDTSRPAIDVTSPYVISTIPVNNATNVPLDQIISATLNEAFNPDTVNTDTFTVFNGPLQVPGSVTHDLANNKMIFTPDANLSANVVYTATVTTGVTDVAGNALESDYIWNFTTGTTISATPPTVILTDPENNDIDVPINRTISALISEELDKNTVDSTTFTLSSDNGSVSVTGDVYYYNKTMFFNPDVNLTADTNYTATVTTDIQDLDGQSMVEDYVWSFTTGDENTTAPYVVSTNPEDNATNVGLNKTISALLNEAADPSTVNTNTFTVFNGSTQVIGTVTYLSKRMFFKPTSPLDPGTEYTATVTTGVTDLDDNNLDDSNGLNTWKFTTGTVASEGPDPVNLGTAEDFAILTKSGISTTGNTLITGDIGVSPAPLSYITGFNETLVGDHAASDLVIGSIYAADMAVPTPAKMTTAVSDMETAYTEAAGRTNPDATELGAGNISGMTIVPGLYKWSTGVLITGAGVTLSGGVNDVWIFQISGDLTVMSDAIVTLEGGAQAKNIFWQIAGGNGVKLGTGSDFKGVVLAQTKIVLDTGATVVEGRLLAQTAVTLDANTITEPTE